VAANWFVALVFRLSVAGFTATEVMLFGTAMVMEAEADLVASCVLVAITTSLPLVAGAV
jgi:purine-cytosine permease-like protein